MEISVNSDNVEDLGNFMAVAIENRVYFVPMFALNAIQSADAGPATRLVRGLITRGLMTLVMGRERSETMYEDARLITEFIRNPKGDGEVFNG
jgi:hypothetical protein